MTYFALVLVGLHFRRLSKRQWAWSIGSNHYKIYRYQWFLNIILIYRSVTILSRKYFYHFGCNAKNSHGEYALVAVNPVFFFFVPAINDYFLSGKYIEFSFLLPKPYGCYYLAENYFIVGVRRQYDFHVPGLINNNSRW